MHPVPVLLQGLLKGPRRVEIHGPGQAFALQRFGGQAVGLLVGEGLEAVLDPAQEDIGRGQVAPNVSGNIAVLRQHIQNRQQPAFLQGRNHPATNQLEELGKELDFPYPTGPEFDVMVHAFAAHFQGNFGFHLAQ